MKPVGLANSPKNPKNPLFPSRSLWVDLVACWCTPTADYYPCSLGRESREKHSTPRSYRGTLGTDAVWEGYSQQPGASPRSRNLRLSLAWLTFGTRPEDLSYLPAKVETTGLSDPRKCRYLERRATSPLFSALPLETPVSPIQQREPPLCFQKVPRISRISYASINPCGNFSLTSSAGWHPPLRIVKPRFPASHYYWECKLSLLLPLCSTRRFCRLWADLRRLPLPCSSFPPQPNSPTQCVCRGMPKHTNPYPPSPGKPGKKIIFSRRGQSPALPVPPGMQSQDP